MKIKPETLFAVIAVVAVMAYFGLVTIPGLNFQAGNTGGNSVPAGLESVNKPVRFNVFDKYGGSALQNQVLSVYDESFTLIDTLTTDANGNDDTNAAHPTGKHLWISMVGADTTNERKWCSVIVPGQTHAEAESLTVNPVTLEMYDYTAPTFAVRFQNGTAAADGENYNHTYTGDNAVFTVSWYQGTEGNGYMSSSDPIYGVQQNAILVMKLSGTGYDVVGVSGMEGGIERASARYFYKVIDPSTLTKWKVGNDYRYAGVGSTSIGLNLASVTGDACLVDFYIYYFADWNYFVNQGSWGPHAASVIGGAPHTIQITTT